MRSRGEIGGRRLHCDYITAREADEQYAVPEPDERGPTRGDSSDGPQCTRPGRAERPRSRDGSGPPPAQRRRRASSSAERGGNGGRGAGHPPDPAGQRRGGSAEADGTNTTDAGIELSNGEMKRHSPNAVPLASIVFDGTPIKLGEAETTGGEQRRHSASPERMNTDSGEQRRWSEGAQPKVETAVEEQEEQPQSCIIVTEEPMEGEGPSEEQLKQLPTYDFDGIRRLVGRGYLIQSIQMY